MRESLTANEKKFLKFALQEHLFDKHHMVLLALSGGLDSMTLLNWLYDLRQELKLEIGLVHVNHGLRAESDFEEASLRQLAEDLQLPIYVDRFTGEFTEAAARQFRYAFFAQIMAERGYTALLTAHHQGDQVETFLMREITGRPLRSLQGIQLRQAFAGGELIRPLLNFQKADFDADFHFEDVTNQGTTYFRNRVRNQLIPELRQENPQFPAAISDLTNEIQLAMAVITDRIEELSVITEGRPVSSHSLPETLAKGDQNFFKVYNDLFQAQTPALQHFILQAYLAKFPALEVNKKQFQMLLQILRRPQQYDQPLNKQYRFVKQSDYFYLEKSLSVLTESEKAPETGQNDSPAFLSAVTEIDLRWQDPKDPSFMAVDLPATGQLEIRRRRPGDLIKINGHHKKLRKFFIENQVPLAQRQNFLLLVDEKVYAIVDLGCSDLSKAIKNDKMKRTVWVKNRQKPYQERN